MHPVFDRPITTEFRKPGKLWSLGYHTGVDYACPVGTDVFAPASGYVVRTAWDRSYGNYILLRCTINGMALNVYLCHLSQFRVKAGQQVRMGQHIAESGNTGNSSGPHLHLEVRKAPYGFNSRDIIDPRIVYNHTEGHVTPVPNKPTVFDLCVWNLAAEHWYTPWQGRAAEIKRELRGKDNTDEASIFLFEEVYTTKQIATIKEALPGFAQLSGPAGLECFYDARKYEKISYTTRASGIQGRFAQIIVLRRLDTGKIITIVHTHAPVQDKALKAAFGVWLAKLAKEVKADVVAGDFNRSRDDLSPRKELVALGYRNFKAQASVFNESLKEFIPNDQDLATIYTLANEGTKVVGGEVDASTNSLESDHRRIEATIVKAA